MTENISDSIIDEKILGFFNDICGVFDGYIDLNKKLTSKFETLRDTANCIIIELAKKSTKKTTQDVVMNEVQDEIIEDTSNVQSNLGKQSIFVIEMIPNQHYP